MRNIITWSVLFILFVTGVDYVSSNDNELRETLEKSWNEFVAATKSGQEAKLEQTMTSYRLGTIKNVLASTQQTLTPEFIIEMAEFTPDITTAEFVEVIENGSTAGLVYGKEMDDPGTGSKQQVEYTFIKFVKEKSGWKVDGVSNTYKDKFQDDGSKTEFKRSDISPSFAIDGQVKKAPDPMSAPDIVGMLDIFSYGYRTEVRVNGVQQRPTVDMSSSGTVDGGLKKGSNSITIVMTSEGEGISHNPEVKIRRALQDNTIEEVFKFAPKDNIEGEHTFSFTVE